MTWRTKVGTREESFRHLQRHGRRQRAGRCLAMLHSQRTLTGMLHGHLAQVVYLGNLPFRAVDDLQMVKFLQHISPGMKIPSRKSIAGRLLDEEYCRQVKHLVAIVRDQHLTISIDGWTGLQNEAFVGVCLGPHMNSLVTEGGSHTAEFFARQITAGIAKL